jgi:hypothetical protein
MVIKMCVNITSSKVQIGKNLSDGFPIQNGLRKGDALSLLLLKFTLEYAIRKAQGSEKGLELNGTHHFLVYTDLRGRKQQKDGEDCIIRTYITCTLHQILFR